MDVTISEIASVTSTSDTNLAEGREKQRDERGRKLQTPVSMSTRIRARAEREKAYTR